MYYVFLNIETTGNIRVPFGQIAHLVSPDMQNTSLSPVFNSRRHGGGEVNLTAINFCSLTDYQKLWHNCSLFIKTSFDPN